MIRPVPALASLIIVSVPFVAVAAPMEPLALMPHRAVYDLRLDRTASRSTVDGAEGRIAFEFSGNVCDGFTTTLRQVVSIATDGGRNAVSDTRSSTWEDGEGKAFRFATQSFVNRNPQTGSEGRAERTVTGSVVVKLAKPEDTRAELGAGIVFPTEHMRLILDAARRDERTLSVKVYDGAESGRKVYDTLSVIGRAVASDAGRPMDAAGDRRELRDVRRWPVTVSYFEAGTGEQTPLYTMTFEIYETGVSRDLLLDYGDFKLRGEMTTLEFLTATPCR